MTCSWQPSASMFPDAWANYEEPVKSRALMLATSSLLTLTYGRVGTCPIKIRPVLPDASGPLAEYAIPGPVGYIEELLVDGTAVDLSTDDWRLDDGHILVWQGSGESPLRAEQDLTKPDTEPGTWSLTYSKSHTVGEDGLLAVALLAMEFAKAQTPRASCGLPRGVTSVVRNGVSFTIEAGLFPGGLTGIEVADQFILKWAPAGAPARTATVFNPRDYTQARTRQTGIIPTRDPFDPPAP